MQPLQRVWTRIAALLLPLTLALVIEAAGMQSSTREGAAALTPGVCEATAGAAAVSPLSSPSASQPLCDSDRLLLQSCLTMLQRWPRWMEQQWRAMSSRKIAKEEVSWKSDAGAEDTLAA